MKILTVLIPAYNIEQTIDELIFTLTDYTILQDIEILIVNDGSHDKTLEKGLIYEKKFPDTVKVINKKNGGHGSTINKGIELALGRYFKVIDGDDWVDTQSFVKLVSYLKSLDVDMVINPFDKVNNVTKQKERYDYKGIEFNHVYSIEEAYSKSNCFIGMHSITYRTQILRSNKIHIDEDRFYVDLEYDLFPVPYLNSIVFLSDSIYQYRCFTVYQSVSTINFQKNRKMHLEVLSSLLYFYGDFCKNLNKVRKDYILNRIGSMIVTQYFIYLTMPISFSTKSELIEFNKEIMKQNVDVKNAVHSNIVTYLQKSKFSLYPLLSLYLKLKNWGKSRV